MTSSQLVFVNTIAQYGRTIINMVLSLYTIRLILSNLGQSDYGIYSLIAGVVAMLSFITNSLVNTTQRFISYYQGIKDGQKLKDIFNNSLVIHILLGIVLILILEICTPFLFNGFLNIPENRIDTAIIVYHLVVLMLFLSFVTSPFRALLISHENIVYLSIIDVFDSLIKVFLVIIMSHLNYDKLLFYSFIMLSVQLINFLCLSIYCFIKYEECIRPNIFKLNRKYITDLGRYAGWNIYGTLCLTGRSQGIAIILNRIYGTIMNAAWGIGAQISGYTNLLSSAVANAMSPQIIKAEGSGNRERTLFLSNILSKTNFFLMSIIGIPCIFEMEEILKLWLTEFPSDTTLFAIIFVIAQLIDSMTIGLTHVNNAIGKIRLYTIVMNTPKFFTFIFAYLLIKMGCSVVSVGIIYIFIEGICSFARIPLISKQAGFKVVKFFNKVIIRELFPLIICVLTCWLIVLFFSFSYRFIFTFIISSMVYTLTFYFCGLTSQEKLIIQNLCKSILQKIK